MPQFKQVKKLGDFGSVPGILQWFHWPQIETYRKARDCFKLRVTAFLCAGVLERAHYARKFKRETDRSAPRLLHPTAVYSLALRRVSDQGTDIYHPLPNRMLETL